MKIEINIPYERFYGLIQVYAYNGDVGAIVSDTGEELDCHIIEEDKE